MLTSNAHQKGTFVMYQYKPIGYKHGITYYDTCFEEVYELFCIGMIEV